VRIDLLSVVHGRRGSARATHLRGGGGLRRGSPEPAPSRSSAWTASWSRSRQTSSRGSPRSPSSGCLFAELCFCRGHIPHRKGSRAAARSRIPPDLRRSTRAGARRNEANRGRWRARQPFLRLPKR
jgi:hypothetical protein